MTPQQGVSRLEEMLMDAIRSGQTLIVESTRTVHMTQVIAHGSNSAIEPLILYFRPGELDSMNVDADTIAV